MPSRTDTTARQPEVCLTDTKYRRDPFPLYEKLRALHPVCQTKPDGVWAISRYKDVQYALKHPELFSSTANTLAPAADWYSEDCRNPRILFAQDPPNHTKYHGLLNRAFITSTIESLKPLMYTTSQSLINLLQTNKELDFTAAFSYPYIGRIIGNLIGLGDNQSLEELREWVALEEENPPTKPSQEFITRYEHAVKRQNHHFLNVIACRRKTPQADLATTLATSVIDNERLTDKELCSLLNLVVSSGFSTTIHMLNFAVLQLSRRSNLRNTLIKFPQYIPAFIEELLRYNPAVHAAFRRTTQDVTLAKITIPAGSLVMPLLASANRDDSVFCHPNEFDIHRKNNPKHLAFGHGIHTCIGAALARLELKIALEVLLNRFSNIMCPSDQQLDWINAPFMHGVRSLPVVFR